MRCNECGYTNPDNARTCNKCQAPLSSGGSYNPPPPPMNPQGGNGGSGKATVKGANANMPYWDDNSRGNAQNDAVSQENSSKSYKNCPNPACGYVLMPEATECPNCDWQATAAAVVGKPEPKKEAPQVVIQQPAQGGNVAKSTMKLGAFNPMTTAQKFSLTDNNSQVKTIYEGDNVEVNRANLDVANTAISSKVHARFVYENGAWYVADESSNQATFVQIKGKVALEDGTVLIVGNKILTFTSE